MTWKLKTAELTEEQFNDRDRIMAKFMKGSYAEFLGGIEYFRGLDVDTLKELVDKGYADPEDAQNSAPTIREIMAAMDANPELTAHGYWVSRDRGDARISIEGVEGTIDPGYVGIFRHADDFEYDGSYIYCWFD